MSTTQRLVSKNFLALGSGEVLARLIAFAATVYIAHRLGAYGFGIIAFATAVVLYLARIADVGIDAGLGAREVAAHRDHLEQIVPTILTLRFVIAVVLMFAFGVGAFLLMPSPDGSVVALYTLTLLTLAVSTRWVLVGLERTSLVAAARTGGELLMALGVFLFVREVGDLGRVPLAQFFGDAAAACFLGVMLRRHGYRFALRWRKDVIRPLARRATPFVASTLLGLMIYNADLIFLRFFRDPTTVGYYAAAYTLVSFLINVGVMYAMSVLPTLTRLSGDSSARDDLYHTSTAHAFAVTLPIAVGGCLLAPGIIDLVFGRAYQPAGVALQLLIASIPFSIVRDIPIVALMSIGREDRVLRTSGAAAVLNVILNLLLIPRYGLAGAAVATVSTEAIRLAVAAWYAHSLGFPALPLRRIWRSALAAAAMGLAMWLVPVRTIGLAVPLGAASYGLVLALLGGVTFGRGTLPRLNV